MNKIKTFFKNKRNMSLKWCFIMYLPACMIIALAGAFGIGVGTNYAQEWYRARYARTVIEDKMEIYFDEYGSPHVGYIKGDNYEGVHKIIYGIISNAQAVLIPAWVIFCVFTAGKIFYNRELREPIAVLMDASRKISEN
ncbi:MAG: hypothetical protein NC192_06995, partial [Muribaculaceae bacterium]|nr:hypothetical protein [Muribaculaceae bacterium]